MRGARYAMPWVCEVCPEACVVLIAPLTCAMAKVASTPSGQNSFMNKLGLEGLGFSQRGNDDGAEIS